MDDHLPDTKSRDLGILGDRRRGRPRKDPTSPLVALSKEHEKELARARIGLEPNVSGTVAAYMMGISIDMLNSRRRTGRGLFPDYTRAKSNKGGTRYNWRSVLDCSEAEVNGRWISAGHQRSEEDDARTLSAALAAAKARRADADAEIESLTKALRRLGVKALGRMLPWAVDDRGRVLGTAAAYPAHLAKPHTTLEALQMPWVERRLRDVLMDAVDSILGDGRQALTSAREASLG